MSLLCPRCYLDLQEKQAPEMALHACANCGGLWLDRQAAAQVNRALSEATLVLVEKLAQDARRTPNESTFINCPVCAQILIRTSIDGAGVSIDRCPEHGVFYDRHELRKVVQALPRTPSRGRQTPAAAKGSPPKEQPQPAQPRKALPKAKPTDLPKPAAPAPSSSDKDSDGVETVLEVGSILLEILVDFI
jgi:Zn-finger nucleic acid-binding protein